MLFEGHDFKEIKEDFDHAARKVFGADISYVLYSGSVAYGGGRVGVSDIDVMVVLKRRLSTEAALAKQIAFAKEYFAIHAKYNFDPDRIFPGEVLSADLAEDAVLGRGFSLHNGRLHLPQASAEYYLADSEHWFRAWISMLAFSVFGSGSFEQFDGFKRRAWRTILLYLISRQIENTVCPDSVIRMLSSGGNKWLGFGITENYHLFSSLEAPYIERVITMLEQEGFLKKEGKSYIADIPLVSKWEMNLVQSIENRDIRNSKLITTLEDVQSICKNSMVLI